MKRYLSSGYIQGAIGLFIGTMSPALGRLIDGQSVGRYTAILYLISLVICFALVLAGVLKTRAMEES